MKILATKCHTITHTYKDTPNMRDVKHDIDNSRTQNT